MADVTADHLGILPLILERLTDLARPFGQGGDPKWCWCSWYRHRNVDFRTATRESNRGVLEAAVEVTERVGRAPGMVAYRGGEAVGWVSLDPREESDCPTFGARLGGRDRMRSVKPSSTGWRTNVIRTWTATLAGAVWLAACAAPGAQPATPDSAPADDSTPMAHSDSAHDAAGGANGGANTAVVTVGTDRYEFADLYCVTIGGALGATSVRGDPKLAIDIPSPGWEASDEELTPAVRVSGHEPALDLRAGGEVVAADGRVLPGMSQVDSFSIDGTRATGTATFVDLNRLTAGEDPKSITGTFEVICEAENS